MVFKMLVGLPACGKTSYAAFEPEESVVVSSDGIRKQLYGDEAIQGDPRVVFDVARQQIVAACHASKNVVFDATNITRKNRASILACVPKTYTKIAVVFALPVDECKMRNKFRARRVPDEVYDKMLSRFECPAKWEGFDEITILGADPALYPHVYALMVNFDQRNHHHKYVLDVHCQKVASKVSDGLYTAACIHDIGKPFTQSGPDSHGDCHYYGHANYGAYIALSCGFDLLTCQLINYHMLPYNKQGNWGKQLPNDFVDMLMELHEADKEDC